MKSKIEITIPDNLSPQEELLEIAKHLGSKMLPEGKTKLLGTGYTIKHSETQITIKREAVEKPIVTYECYCGTVFEKGTGEKVYHNYGGNPKVLNVCSKDCQHNVITMCGDGRASAKRKDLQPVRSY